VSLVSPDAAPPQVPVLEDTGTPPETRRAAWTNLPFLGMHLACVLVLWTGISPTAAWIGLATLLVRMFGLTGGYHRYFCHHSFKTSRVFQFMLAWAGAAAAQKGPLWWAGPPSVLGHRGRCAPPRGQGFLLGPHRLGHG